MRPIAHLSPLGKMASLKGSLIRTDPLQLTELLTDTVVGKSKRWHLLDRAKSGRENPNN